MGSSLNMLAKIVSLSLVALAAGQAAVPLTPGNIPGLVPGSPAAAAWWTAQIAHRGQLAHHVGKRQASVPLTPGNIVDLSLAPLLLLIGGLHRLLTVVRLLTMWARGKLPSLCPLETFPDLSLAPLLLLPGGLP